MQDAIVRVKRERCPFRAIESQSQLPALNQQMAWWEKHILKGKIKAAIDTQRVYRAHR